MIKRCPKCGSTRLSATAIVSQNWRLNKNGTFVKILDDMLEVQHYPNDEDTWDCDDCGYSGKGVNFNVDSN